MKTTVIVMGMILCLTTLFGCETMEKGGYKAGEYSGKATRVGDKVSEGAVDGYMGEETTSNPYNR
jgi:hypothetical protein